MSGSASGTDEALYLAFRDRGDAAALDGLIGRHWSRAFRLALGLVRDPGAAEDVAQEAFVQVVAAARARQTLDPFGGWLTCVVLNGARKSLRSARRRAQHEDVARALRPEETTVTPTSIDDYAALLPDELAAPVLLHYGLGLTHQETAAALGCPTGTVASRLRSGLERLRTSVGASVALEAGLAESWSPAREANVPTAPRAADVLARAPGSLAPGSLAPARSGWALPGTSAAIVLTAVLALSVAGVAFNGLSPRSHDAPGSAESALAPPSSASGPAPRSGESASSGSATAAGNPRAPGPPSLQAAAAAPVTTAASESPALALEPEDLGEPEGRAPAYPWHEWSAEERAAIAESERILRERTLSVSFQDCPLVEAVQWWNDVALDLGLPRAFFDERLDPELVKGMKVNLKLREITARNALSLILAVSEELRDDVEVGGIRISAAGSHPLTVPDDPALSSAVEWLQIPRLPDKRLRAMKALTPEQVEQQRAAAERYRNVLSQRVDLDVFEVPLSEFLDKLSDLTQVNFTVSKTIDTEVVKVTSSSHGATVAEVLGPVMARSGFVYRMKNESVYVCPKEEVKREAPDDAGVWAEPASLDRRAIPLRDVVEILEKHNVLVVLSPEAWRSNGTISIAMKPGATVKHLLDLLGGQLGVSSTVIDQEQDDDGNATSARVRFTGTVPSAREALEAPLPSFAGVARQVREERARLVAALRARRAARAAVKIEPGELVARERDVAVAARAVLDLVRRAAAVEGARERRAALGVLDGLDFAVDQARRRVPPGDAGVMSREARVLEGLLAKRDERAFDIAGADAAVALLEKLEKGESLPPETSPAPTAGK